MSPRYPINRSNERRLPQGYDGPVLIWDVDKTYLNTQFSTWHGLLAIPFEFAIDKRPITGAVELLHALRHGPHADSRLTPLYFVSASPPELRRVIERRMVLDGVEHDGITFKDQLALLKRGRLGQLKRQVGYKLVALLRYARELPANVVYLMFGDDAEDDANIFTLFGDIVAGLRNEPLDHKLRSLECNDGEREEIMRLTAELGHGQSLRRVFIHRVRGRDIDYANVYQGRVVATDGFFEQALLLLADGQIDARHAARVGRALLARDLDDAGLAEHMASMQEKHGLPDALIEALRVAL